MNIKTLSHTLITLALLAVFTISVVHIVKRRGEQTFALTLTCENHQLKKGDHLAVKAIVDGEALEKWFIVRKIVDRNRFEIAAPTFVERAVHACRASCLSTFMFARSLGTMSGL
jgi:hypothetical protein